MDRFSTSAKNPKGFCAALAKMKSVNVFGAVSAIAVLMGNCGFAGTTTRTDHGERFRN